MKYYKAEFDKQGDVLNIKVKGRLDVTSSPEMEEELNPYLPETREIVMDLGSVDYISSAGIRLLLATEQYLEGRGGSMKLINVNDHIYKVFDMVGFANLMTIERL